MRVAVIRIGNSKGIRLNKMLLAKYQIEDEVELILEPESILIRPVVRPRHDWDKSFEKMKKKGDDSLLIDSVLDPEDWE
ncbi:MAG TPA: AbrB/MazE/SpoVT family DNA-binding domain-containing protein [Saprospiraceae bacterium]